MVDDSCDGIQGSCFEEIVSCSGYYRGSVREGKVKTDANYIISKVVGSSMKVFLGATQRIIMNYRTSLFSYET